MTVNTVNGLAKLGNNVHLCVTRDEGNLKNLVCKSVGYTFLRKRYAIDVKAIKKLHRYVKKNNIKLLHAHSTSYFIATIIKLFHPKVRIIWHNHSGNSSNMHYLKLLVLKACSFNFDVVISVNNELKNWSQEQLYAKKNVYLHNFASFYNSEIKETILKGEKNKRIICLANFREPKNHGYIINTFKIIHKNYPNWTLHLVGSDFNDTYSNKIKLLIETEQLVNHVFLYTNKTDIKHILRQATIAILGSKNEGLPVALLEYGLTKLPVVVTNVGACADVIKDDETGFVVPLNNEKLFATKIIELIQNKPLRENFGLTFYNFILQNYSEEEFFKKLISIYSVE